jgi:hypothetical protein
VEGVSPLRRGTTLATLAAVLDEDEAVPPPVRSGPLTPVLQALLVRDPAARPDAARLDAMLAQAESGTAPDPDRALPASTAPLPPASPAPPVSPTAPTDVLRVPADVRRAPADAMRVPPASAGPSRGPGRRRGRAALVVTAVVVALATAATTLALTLGNRNGDDGGEARGAEGAGRSTTAGPSAPSARRTPAPTPSSPAPSKKTVAQPTASEDTGDGEGAGDGWIAQLHSEPVGTGTAARDRRLATVRQSVPEAVYVRSDDYASLRPGFWVFYAPGPFADGRAALAFCDARGRTTPTTCVGRYLSTDADDRGLQCRPPAATPTGRCTRP